MTETIQNLAMMDEYNEYRAYERINHTPEKKQFYRSIYADKVRKEDKEYVDKFSGHKTMGLSPNSYRPSPHNWVKKDQFHPDLPEPKEFHYDETVPRRPPIPDQIKDAPIMGKKSNVDFVQQNIKKVQHMIPKVSTKKEIDWTQKNDFGQVPEYLSKVKDQISKEQEQLRKIEQGQSTREVAFRIEDTEKDQMLAGLKENWKELHDEYIGTTKAVVDTLGQKHRKMWLETRMAEIEADIVLLEKGDVYVK